MARRRRLLTPEQEAWAKERYPHAINAELVKALHDEYGVTITTEQITAWAKRNGLRKTAEAVSMTRSKLYPRRVYSDEMYDFIREYVPGRVYPEVADEFERRFGWRIEKSQYKNLCMKLGVRSGVHDYGCFKRGHVPANKGKRWDDYMSPEAQERVRSAGNLFKRGQRSTNAYHKLLDMRTDPDGHTYIYVRPRGAKYSAQMWLSYGQFVWMQANGREFPEDCRCVHANRDKADFTPENLVAVPNDIYGLVTGKVGRGLDWWDRESLEVAMTFARVKTARYRMERDVPRECAVCGRTFVPEGKWRRYGERVRTCRECLEMGRKAKTETEEAMQQRDIVGFGHSSADHATTTSNAFVRVTTTPVTEGAEVTVECRDGFRFEDGDAVKTLTLVRKRREPRPGQRVMVGNRLVKVLKTRHDHAGRLELLNEDTLEWVIWDE